MRVSAFTLQEVPIVLCDFFFKMKPAPFITEHPEVSGSPCSYLKARLLSSDQHTACEQTLSIPACFPLGPTQTGTRQESHQVPGAENALLI